MVQLVENLERMEFRNVVVDGRRMLTHYTEIRDFDIDADKGNYRLEVMFTPTLSKLKYFDTKEELVDYIQERANYNSII